MTQQDNQPPISNIKNTCNRIIQEVDELFNDIRNLNLNNEQWVLDFVDDLNARSVEF